MNCDLVTSTAVAVLKIKLWGVFCKGSPNFNLS